MLTITFAAGVACGLAYRWFDLRRLRADLDAERRLAEWRGELLTRRGRSA